MIYAFICKECGTKLDDRSHERTHHHCGRLMARDYSYVQLRAVDPFKPHFNHATGKFVNNRGEFEDALRRGSEANSAATGIDHTYAPLYPGDMPRPTAADDIFETRARVMRDGPSAAPAAPNPAPSEINYDGKVNA